MSGSILVVGSVAFDSVKTPFGEVDEILGGSATYFSVASSYFAPVRVVAVVGSDFGDRHIEIFRKHQIDIEGLNHPKRMFDLAEGLIRRKYADADIELILGGNFKRVLSAIWTV